LKKILVLVVLLTGGAVLARQATAVFSWTTLAGRAATDAVDGNALSAIFSSPAGVLAVGDGSILVADADASAIRRVTSDGAVTTYAGRIGHAGWADGPVADARFARPLNLALAPNGDVFVHDEIGFGGGVRIRRITPAGVVSTFVQFSSSVRGSMAVGPDGSLYVTFGGPIILRVTPGGIQTTITVSTTQTISVSGVTWHPNLGLLAVISRTAVSVAQVSETGVVTTLAGSQTCTQSSGCYDPVDGVGASARFSTILAISAGPSGRVWMFEEFAVRTLDPDGTVRTVAGAFRNSGMVNASGPAARFSRATGITEYADGSASVADTANRVIRRVTTAGEVSTVAGSDVFVVARNGTGVLARFGRAAGVDMDAAGNLLVADLAGHAIRHVTPTGAVTTFAGQLGVGGFTNGVRDTAYFNFPIDVAVAPEGYVYVADYGNHAIRLIDPQGGVTTVAGAQPSSVFTPGSGAGFVDGPGVDARFNLPSAIALAPSGELYVADYGNAAVRVVATDGTVRTLVTQTATTRPVGIAWAPGGYLIVTETTGIRRLELNGSSTVIAGFAGSLPIAPSSVDGTGSAARFTRAAGVDVDSDGVAYVADNVAVRRVTPQGVVTTIGGSSIARIGADAVGTLAAFREAWGVARSSDGRVFVAEDARVRVGTPTSGTPPTIVVEPADPVAADGEAAIVTLEASGSPAPEYALERRYVRSIHPPGSQITVWEPVMQPNGGFWSTTPSLSTGRVRVADAGSQFRVIVSNGVGRVVSRQMTLTVTGAPLLSSISGDRSIRVGSARTFSVTVSGGSPAPTLQWQTSADGVSGWAAIPEGAPYSGTTTSSLSISAAPISLHGRYLRAVATNTHGSATTDALQVTVNPLVFTQQPTDVSTRSGQTVTFTAVVDAFGSTPTYQWQYLSGSTWTSFIDSSTVTGAQTSSLVLSQVAQSLSVRVVVSANGGSRTSRTTTLAVVDASLSVSPASLAFVARHAAGGFLEFPERQSVLVGTIGPSGFDWLVSSQPAWITSGKAQDGRLNVLLDITFDYTGATELSGTIVLVGSPAGVTASIPVTATIRPASTNALPFGNLDTPATGATGLAGAVPVTGWALDDIGVRRVEIWRDCIEAIDRSRGACRATPNGDADAVYVGDVLFVSGARPDVASQFSSFPQAGRAGWGLMVLTNMLPHIPSGAAVGGQGTFLLSAYAIDTAGQAAVIGRSSVTVDNDNSQLPFGAIDAPVSGGLLTGSQVFLGWGIGARNRCLTSFRMYVDGVEITTSNGLNMALRTHRPDVDPLFPSSCPAQQKGLGFYLTGLAIPNGRHTVSFEATDDLGNVGSFGSRFFDVLAPVAADTMIAAAVTSEATVSARSQTRTVRVRVGGPDAPVTTVSRGDDGTFTTRLVPGERLWVELGTRVLSASHLVNGESKSLPGGSSLNTLAGTFAWEPPIGYYGPFVLVFELEGETLTLVVEIGGA